MEVVAAVVVLIPKFISGKPLFMVLLANYTSDNTNSTNIAIDYNSIKWFER